LLIRILPDRLRDGMLKRMVKYPRSV
jgi:hypothetical protein